MPRDQKFIMTAAAEPRAFFAMRQAEKISVRAEKIFRATGFTEIPGVSCTRDISDHKPQFPSRGAGGSVRCPFDHIGFEQIGVR
jgi:hypothetical protein